MELKSGYLPDKAGGWSEKFQKEKKKERKKEK